MPDYINDEQIIIYDIKNNKIINDYVGELKFSNIK
jgi:hypothetical protein